MPNFTVYKTDTGEIVSSGTMATEEWCLAQARPGESVHLGPARFDQYFKDGELVDLPAKPSDNHVFDYATHEWVDPRSLLDLRAQLKASVSAHRYELEVGGITMPNGMPVKTDRESRATLKQLISDLEDVGLTSADYKTDAGFITLSIEDLRGIAIAITLHVQSCFTAERLHVERINALGDLESAKSYDTTADWPP